MDEQINQTKPNHNTDWLVLEALFRL